MDIFTTQLTRVVPVPIKPASLKVKALLKDAANSKLTQDPDHLENHEYYFTTESDQYHSSKEDAKKEQKNQQAQSEADEANQTDVVTQQASEIDENTVEKSDKPKHLDLYA
jgi:hypothetical protein